MLENLLLYFSSVYMNCVLHFGIVSSDQHCFFVFVFFFLSNKIGKYSSRYRIAVAVGVFSPVATGVPN